MMMIHLKMQVRRLGKSTNERVIVAMHFCDKNIPDYISTFFIICYMCHIILVWIDLPE